MSKQVTQAGGLLVGFRLHRAAQLASELHDLGLPGQVTLGVVRDLADVPDRYEGYFSAQFAHPMPVRCAIEYGPRKGRGPTFRHEFVVTPDRGGFREDLVRHNGAPPEAAEQEHHRRAGSFGRHYGTLLAGVGGEEEEGGYSLGQLLHLSSYRFAGREALNGVDCYRLDFSPDDVQPRMGGLAAKFTKAMAGSLWITVEGFHLAGAKAETVRPISIALSLSKVYSLKVRMDAGPVGEGVWLPERVEVITNARILIKSIRRRNLFTYSDFLRLGPPG